LRPLNGTGLGKLLAGSGNGETSVVKQFLHFKDKLHILFFIDPVAGFGFLRGEEWKFGFPKSENVGLNADDFADFTNLEKQLVRDLGLRHAGDYNDRGDR